MAGMMKKILFLSIVLLMLQPQTVLAYIPGGGGGGGGGTYWSYDYAPFRWGAYGNSGNLEEIGELHVMEYDGGSVVIPLYETLPQTAFGDSNINSGRIRVKVDTNSGYAWAMVVGGYALNGGNPPYYQGVDVTFNGILDAYIRCHPYGWPFTFSLVKIVIYMYDYDTGEHLDHKEVFSFRREGDFWGYYKWYEVDEIFTIGEVVAHFSIPPTTVVEFGIYLEGMIVGDSGRVWQDKNVNDFAYLLVNSIAKRYT